MTTGSKTALVTGGSGGIGKAVVKRLAADGFCTIVHYAGNSKRADATVAEITSAGGQAVAVQADIATEEDVNRMFEEALKAYGHLDAVVNCAGIMPLSPVAKEDAVTFDKVIATNLRGSFLVMAQAAQHVAEGGRIIMFSSSMIAKSFPTYGAYVASKSGVEGLVRVLANELRGRNITVNAVAPGPIATDLFFHGKDEAKIEEFKKLTPLERLGQPEDIAGAISFLCSPDGSWVNAQTVRVNGGFA